MSAYYSAASNPYMLSSLLCLFIKWYAQAHFWFWCAVSCFSWSWSGKCGAYWHLAWGRDPHLLHQKRASLCLITWSLMERSCPSTLVHLGSPGDPEKKMKSDLETWQSWTEVPKWPRPVESHLFLSQHGCAKYKQWWNVRPFAIQWKPRNY